MIYNLKVPKENSLYGFYNLLVETQYKHTLEELKELLYKENISEDLKDNISFVTSMTIETQEAKDFLVKHGLSIIKIKESE